MTGPVAAAAPVGAPAPPAHAPGEPAGSIHPALASAFAALDAGGVRWALIRGAAELEAPAGDVDLLIHHRDPAQARTALIRAGWVADPRPGRGSHRFFARYVTTDRRWLKLDIVTRLAFGARFELDSGTAERALARRRRVGGGWRLDREDEAAALALHLLLDRTAPPNATDRRRITQAGVRRRPDADALAGWAERLAPGLLGSAHQWTTSPGAWLAVRRRARRRAVVAAPLGVAWRLAADGVRRRVARLPALASRGGLTVALVGPDGSGKTSIGARIAAESPLPVHRAYLGLYPTATESVEDGSYRGAGALTRARRLIARRVGALPGASGVRRVARVWRAWAGGAANARRGGLTLFDRHPLEAALGGHARLRQRLLARCCPAPDLIVLLDAPASVVHARKPEHPLPVVEEQRRAYLAIADRRDDVFIVDGTRPIDEVTAAVTSLIWMRWADRRDEPETVVPV